jgi:hypothetical protein
MKRSFYYLVTATLMDPTEADCIEIGVFLEFYHSEIIFFGKEHKLYKYLEYSIKYNRGSITVIILKLYLDLINIH